MITGMSDWGRFLNEVSWFVEPGQTVTLGDPQSWSRPSVAALPVVSGLLRSATMTPVSVGGEAYESLAWGPPADGKEMALFPAP